MISILVPCLCLRRRWTIPLDEERELALQRLKVLCATGSFSVMDFR